MRTYPFALVTLCAVTIFLISCTVESGTSDNVGTPPPVASPLELGDITTTPSGGDTSPYAAATVTIEGAVIVVSGITNLADATSETLMMSIADRDDPAAYTVEPASITIPGTVLNPDGTAAVTNRLEGVQFVLTPVAAGSEAITYSIEVRLAEFVAPPVLLPSFAVEDVTITPSSGDTSPYAAATVTIEGSVIVVSGITNLAVATSETLMMSIADRDDPAAYTADPSSVTILADVLNPDGTNAVTNRLEGVQFVLTPVAAGGETITYSIEVRLAEFIAPPAPLPAFVVADITITPSGGPTSPYAAATPTLEGDTIIISGITNLDDMVRTETLAVSIADTDTPADYTAAPSSITIPANVLNPVGTGVVNAVVPNVAFVLTPVAAGGMAVTFNVELRLDALAPLTPLTASDITFDSRRDPAYSAAMVSSVMGNVITISGIKNKEDGFSAALILMVSPSYRIAVRGSSITGTGDALNIPSARVNPSGVASITTSPNDENLSFTVTAAQSVSTSEKYYVRLMLGDLIQLKLLAGSTGAFTSEVVLSEGTSSSGMMVSLKNCGVVTGSPSHEVLVGGAVSTAYTLTGTVDSYVASSQTDFVLRQGAESLTFPLSVSSSCTTAGLSGGGTSGSPYIIDNDRKLYLLATLVNAGMTGYTNAHYRVTERINLGIAQAPWSETKSGANGGGFPPIGRGSSTSFAGTFDCSNNEIANLYINRGTSDNVGLFGYASSATIQNCYLVDAKVTGRSDVGGIIGENTNSVINDSYVTGSVTGVAVAGSANSGVNVGGLVGMHVNGPSGNNNTAINNSYAVVTVNGSDAVGGLVGYSLGVVRVSYASGSVVASGNGAGGLVGINSSSSATVTNSYATATVTGNSIVGGLVGSNSAGYIHTSYSIGKPTGTSSVGGMLGVGTGGNIFRSYWDTTTTETSTSAGGTGQTTSQLQSATSLSSWSGTIWQFTPNNQYPRLKGVVCANRQYADPVPTDCTGL
ncbi:hypothetical protein COTS27_01013 [Spirochaetota bacterium]|nr:hypothetical protein COTS27_01013 [Spirochaetota bacterium]